jgi:Sulfite exporter TauE/SafE
MATAAGAFSALFGVGGGTIIVPLLVLWLGYGHREATGTSLAATALQQRVPERGMAAAFVVLLVASAAVLVF